MGSKTAACCGFDAARPDKESRFLQGPITFAAISHDSVISRKNDLGSGMAVARQAGLTAVAAEKAGTRSSFLSKVLSRTGESSRSSKKGTSSKVC